MKSGKLSFSIDDDGNKLIEASELARVYGDLCDFSREEGDNAVEPVRIESPSKPLPSELQRLNDQLIEQYKSQVEDLREALSKSQDGLNRTTLLLEHQANHNKGWEEQFSRLEKLISNQEEETTRLKRALQAERKKSLWKKLIG